MIAEDRRAAPEPLEPAPARGSAQRWAARVAIHAPAAAAYLGLVLMVVWAAHDGGYDADTWYWGALALLAVSATVGWATRPAPLSTPMRWALGLLGVYVLFSYMSIAWAGSPGDALNGSDRALLYLLVALAFARVAWRPGQVLGVLTGWALAVGAIGLVTLVHMTHAAGAPGLFSEGRLITPTGYFNSNAALFTASALLSTTLGARRELPAVLRGLLLALAGASLDLALLAQSRGWLFTLPAVLLVAVAVSRDRLRLAAAAVLPTLGALAATPASLAVYRALTEPGGAPGRSAAHAATLILAIAVAVFVAATAAAVLDAASQRPRLGLAARRGIGLVLALVLLAVGSGGALALSHGHPVRFAAHQWRGFTHPGADTSSTGSHFTDVGSGRWDAWRVALDAFRAHPLGGLGQDNFADVYIRARHTGEELQWTHSWEMRLLAHTGLIGTLLFLGFLAVAMHAALRGDLRDLGQRAALRGAALLPLVVWLVHGSVDWFWEIPALAAPALGFLAMAGSFSAAPPAAVRAPGDAAAGAEAAAAGAAAAGAEAAAAGTARSSRVARPVAALAVAAAAIAAVLVLGLPYLSVRDVSIAGRLRASDPAAALTALSTAARLNPLAADPDRIAGTIALQNGWYAVAEQRFAAAITREPAGWYAWFGAGLAASARGQRRLAHADLAVAAAINNRQPAVLDALRAVRERHPLSPARALNELVLAH